MTRKQRKEIRAVADGFERALRDATAQCLGPDCDNAPAVDGLCPAHYQQRPRRGPQGEGK